LFEAGVPVLGHLLRRAGDGASTGGEVEAGHHASFRPRRGAGHRGHAAVRGVWKKGESYPSWMSHGDRVTPAAEGLPHRRHLRHAPIAMIAEREAEVLRTQFHLEVMHTPQGAQLLRNFVRKIAQCRGDWTMRAFKDEAVEKIRKQVGKGRVICGLSGGVDSAVAAVLIHEAIGDQLTCVFVDHGLLRLNEARPSSTCSAAIYNIPLVHVDASDTFLGALQGTSDPEAKRKTIGRLFIDVFEARRRRSAARISGPGTLYPDVIESVSFTGMCSMYLDLSLLLN